MTPTRVETARDMLAFQAEAGADMPLDEIAIDRLAAAEVAPAASAQAPPPRNGLREPLRRDIAPAPGAAPAAPDAAIMAARAMAKSAASLELLRGILEKFEGCALRVTAKQLVFADGNPQARVMFVGEAPGREEDLEGLPFVGRSGKLLDRMLAAIGLNRTTAYIANIVPWRPPGNRTPTPQESQICLPFIRRQIELANPASASRRWRRCSASRTASGARAGAGFPTTPARARSARSRPSIRPICCARRWRSASRGGIFWPSRRRSTHERMRPGNRRAVW
jgi:hypothetical protein